MEEFFEIFRLNIKHYRGEKNYSQRDLAIQADCTDGMIGQIEAGRTKPSFEMIIKLANALEVTVSSLFDFSFRYFSPLKILLNNVPIASSIK